MNNSSFLSSVTRQMNKQFCPECGNPSLQRASVTVDPSGQRHYHLTGRYRPISHVGLSAILLVLHSKKKFV